MLGKNKRQAIVNITIKLQVSTGELTKSSEVFIKQVFHRVNFHNGWQTDVEMVTVIVRGFKPLKDLRAGERR